MMAAAQRTLRRYEVGGLPLIHALAQRMGLRALLERFVATMAMTRCRGSTP